jgi:membrane protein
LNVSHNFKRMLSLQIAAILVKRFVAGQLPLTASQISDQIDVPIRLVQDILFELTEAGIISEIKDVTYKESAYQPARDVNQLTICSVNDVLDKKGVSDIPVARTAELEKIQVSLQDFEVQMKRSGANCMLKDI